VSLLQVQDVSRHFGSLIAVDHVSMTVEPGELRAVIGPNGAGKTTFFNMISGFFPPTSGTIVFDEKDITAWPAHKRVASGMARTFQITEIFPELSVRENLRIPVEVAAETLAVVGIEIKLLAELHEIYGQPAVGSAADRARAYIGAWASRRGVYQVDGGLLLIAGSPLARQLTRRLAARVRRSAFSLSPLLTGALAGVLLNRRETRRLGRQIRDDLRSRRTTFTASVIGRPTATPGV